MKYFAATFLLLFWSSAIHVQSWSPWHETHMRPNRSVIVQLFEWRLDDIAAECENVLGPLGYGGVQVSPIGEHMLIDEGEGKIRQPWYQRYQCVSYKLGSRSGNHEQLVDMVKRCNDAGVRVYMDMVINHMTADSEGTGSAGSKYNGHKRDYPGVPFNKSHFNTKEKCGSIDGGIHDFEDPWESRNCELVGLHDLDQSQEYVRSKQVDYFNSLIKLGVAGFRIDASKHMYPQTIKQTFDKLDHLIPMFGPGSRPFMYHESSALGGEERGIKAAEYTGVGKVLNFKYMHNIRDIMLKYNHMRLRYLKNFGEGWNMLPNEDNVPIVDNHDLQRSFARPNVREGSNFRSPRQMKLANAFMLAWPYGTPKVMSSYDWPVKMTAPMVDQNVWYGPPHDENDIYKIKHVTTNDDASCGNGWICEHRWHVIHSMVKFRSVVGDAPVTAWWDNGENAIAFAREGKGFLAMNNEDIAMDETLQTTLPSGIYCDVISGKKQDNTCTGTVVTVGSNGKARIQVPSSEDSLLAIHLESKLQ